MRHPLSVYMQSRHDYYPVTCLRQTELQPGVGTHRIEHILQLIDDRDQLVHDEKTCASTSLRRAVTNSCLLQQQDWITNSARENLMGVVCQESCLLAQPTIHCEPDLKRKQHELATIHICLQGYGASLCQGDLGRGRLESQDLALIADYFQIQSIAKSWILDFTIGQASTHTW